MAQTQPYPYGAEVTLDAGTPLYPIIGSASLTAGLLLYAFVYEARWAGLKTGEVCPRWYELPDLYRKQWEKLAKQISSLIPENV